MPTSRSDYNCNPKPMDSSKAKARAGKQITLLLRVRGVVQGVGFRPFVYRLARELDIKGWVRNDVHGVTIAASAPPAVLEEFRTKLQQEAPPAAVVEEVVELERRPNGDSFADFEIVASEDAPGVTVLISPDLPVCEDCLREMRDPRDRRYRYPFINCTNCGPRYSIILALPYDRPNTTMREFPLCADCECEYHDPLDRRFHAQPVACPECGPTLLYVKDGEEVARGDAVIALAAQALRAGKILAIKGLGGYHLACDATNEGAVDELRRRKYRKEKPFALLARDLKAIEDYVVLTDEARELLQSKARPIVLLRKKTAPEDKKRLPEALAPENAYLGVMLPYTPLHYLLFDSGTPELLVMTSGNYSSEPIAYRDDEALKRLTGIADGFVIGERPIARRVDDSVTMLAGTPVIVRRARGYAPAPVVSSPAFKGRTILGVGAELKNSITLVVNDKAFVSQHLGDLENLETYEAFRETIHDLARMYRVNLKDTLVVHDLHPDYRSTRYAAELPGARLAVQHHKAHIASVLAEHDAWETPVLGFAFDGAGLGEDGTVWGGEIFCGSMKDLKRVGGLRRAPLPGGDAAARHPVQAAVGFISQLGPAVRFLVEKLGFPERTVLLAQKLCASKSTPWTSSIGRLFDTVSALTGFTRKMSFEGQAAIRLEALALQAPEREQRARAGYPFPFEDNTWDYRPLLEAILDDLDAGVPAEVIAWRFHTALAEAVLAAACRLREKLRFTAVVISGGVFQNQLLHRLVRELLTANGFQVWWNEQVPPNDGGISLGQVALGAASERDRRA